MPFTGGAAVRTQITDKVFTANESPSSEKIPFHHEMSQVITAQFFCLENSQFTIIALSDSWIAINKSSSTLLDGIL
jgi:hypothetical protein